MKKKLFKLALFFSWAAVLCSLFWILNNNKNNQVIGFRGFNTKPITKRFEFTDIKSKEELNWLKVDGYISNISNEQLMVRGITFNFYNQKDEIIKSKEYLIGKELKAGDKQAFNLEMEQSSCFSQVGFNKFDCTSVSDFASLRIKYFKADINWQRESLPERTRNYLKAGQPVNLISKIKIEKADQSYTLNKTAKLTYSVNGKLKSIYGEFADMITYGTVPRMEDVNNDGVKELVLINGNSSQGSNYIIMELVGEDLEPLNILTESYSTFGDLIEKKYSDNGITSLELSDFNSDGFIDLKDSLSGRIYYWDEDRRLHVLRVVEGIN